MSDSESSMDAVRARLLTAIADQGWALLATTTPIHEGGIPFAYTIGLEHSVRHPEILLAGLPTAMLAGVLRTVAARVMAGAVIADGAVWTDVLADAVPVQFRTMTARHVAQYLLQAPLLEPKVSPLRALHLVYPDAHGRWPWDARTTPSFRAGQPATWSDTPGLIGRV